MFMYNLFQLSIFVSQNEKLESGGGGSRIYVLVLLLHRGPELVKVSSTYNI